MISRRRVAASGTRCTLYIGYIRYRPLRRPTQPCYGRTGAASPSIPRIADQRLARTEQDHQQDTDHAQHGKNRLVEDDLDDAIPKPGHLAFHPGPERLLAGLMDVIPELTEPGEAQALIGDEARTVIDHEDETAGQQQQPDKSEKTADHASPYICRRQ